MELDMNESHWKTACPKVDCRDKNKCCCGLKHVVIPASLGDDSESSPVAPENGAYCSSIVIYEANSHVYIYSTEGIPTLIDVDATDISELETLTRRAIEKIDEIEDSVVFAFDTVADMQASTTLVSGSFVRTLGFHSKDDGGGAWYKIVNVQPSGYYEVLGNFLYAELITDGFVNVRQLGAYGDNIHDDTNALKAAFANSNVKIYVPVGTYRLQESLTLLTNTVLTGDGPTSKIRWTSGYTDDYILDVPITSKNCRIDNIAFDGNLRSNGVYDGKGREGDAATQLRMNRVTIILCKIGLRMDAMGSTIEDSYIAGNFTNNNSGGMDTGIYVTSTDNSISSTRIGGFSNYGIRNMRDGTRITNVKCYLNGVGCYFKGTEISASVLEAQENFYDNFQFYQVHSSFFDIASGGAGTEDRNGAPWPIPSVLNEYAHLNIEECDSLIIKSTFTSRVAYGTRDWSCEGYIIKLKNSIGINIDGSSFTVHYTKDALPVLVSADNLAGNKIVINGLECTNSLTKTEVTLSSGYYTTLNGQSGDNYDLSISPGASGGIVMVSFPYFECNNIAIFNMFDESIYVSNMSFRYTVSGVNYDVSMQPYLIGTRTSDLSTYRVVCNLGELIANDEQYQQFISQGATITNKKNCFDG